MCTTMLPGFTSPAVGFEQPFEMLEACHERVQRSVDLLQRLAQHLHAVGNDTAARQAAADVLRYFDLAAPHHHEDEERHVFPPLLALPQDTAHAAVHAAVRQLQQDHRDMHRLWMSLREALVRIAGGHEADFAHQDLAVLHRFTGLYASHIALEESVIYPAARALLDEAGLAAMGAEMAGRRRGP
jgi:hemerythrin-like domain-containing protein